LSVYHTANNRLRTAAILEVKNESATVKTFAFKDRLCRGARPGQFLMLWIPGTDEIPLSILDVQDDNSVLVAVKNVGSATFALHKMKVGDVIGLRGPFGNSFTTAHGRILMVCGGTGMGPLFFLTKEMSKAERIVFLMGAKTKAELIFLNELNTILPKGKSKLITTTEDGTCGITGLCTEPLERILAKEGFDMIYSCGPEGMLQKVFQIAEKKGIRMEASLERLMRCGIGVCGSCAIGKYRVCADGPVFTSERLREITGEFGVTKRDFNGKKIPI
jgi:dihydroorotate dehydrogenase electron transfer subunit